MHLHKKKLFYLMSAIFIISVILSIVSAVLTMINIEQGKKSIIENLIGGALAISFFVCFVCTCAGFGIYDNSDNNYYGSNQCNDDVFECGILGIILPLVAGGLFAQINTIKNLCQKNDIQIADKFSISSLCFLGLGAGLCILAVFIKEKCKSTQQKTIKDPSINIRNINIAQQSEKTGQNVSSNINIDNQTVQQLERGNVKNEVPKHNDSQHNNQIEIENYNTETQNKNLPPISSNILLNTEITYTCDKSNLYYYK